MGKLILCNGVRAKKPFQWNQSNINLYTIEELCYYLYHNIYTISEEDFSISLVKWLQEEIKMEEIAEKLKGMIQEKNSLKDMAITVICSGDYYTEEEVRELIHTIDEIAGLIPVKRKKIKADSYLNNKNYIMAEREYSRILKSENAFELTPEEYGDVLHNQAVACIHTSSYREAAERWKEAYSRNHKEETLKQYIFALKLAGGKKPIEEQIQDFGVSKEMLASTLEEWNKNWLDAEETPLYMRLKEAKELKKIGKVEEYYGMIDQLIREWKQAYQSQQM